MTVRVATAAELADLKRKLGPEGYRRAMAHACWKAGDLSYLLHEGQIRAREMVKRVHADALATSRAKRALLNIARRWGKTFFFVVWALELLLRRPGARVPYAAMTETSVREFVEPILRYLASEAPEGYAPEERKGEWVIPATSARLVVKGCEDRKKADRLRGPAADGAVIDEAGFIPVLDYVVREVVAPQLITTDGMMLIGSSAPESPEHEFWSLCDEAAERDAYMHATIYDAPHITTAQIASYAAEAGGEDTPAWQREGLSRRIVDMTRAVYPEWATAALEHELRPELALPVIGEVERPEFFDAYVVGDLGFADMTFVLFGYYDFRSARLIVEDEVVTQRETSDVIERKVREKRAALWGDKRPHKQKLEGDALVVASIRKEERIASGEAKRGEVDVTAIDDPTAWRQIAFVQMEAAVNAARVRIKRRGVLVHPRCVQLIAHMGGAIWNAQRTAFERVVRNGQVVHHFDGAAAFAYLVRELEPNRNPYPALPSHVTASNGWHIPAPPKASGFKNWKG